MANKIKLGSRPGSFKRTVTFPMLDGEEGSIEVTFKYRTRLEFGKFIDGVFADAKLPATPTISDPPPSMAKAMEQARDKNATYLLQVVEAWDLDEPLNHNTALQLCDEVPAAAGAIMEAYKLAILEGRVKN